MQPTVLRPKARELIAGIADDPVFGPAIVFGRGGTAVEVINDRELALPPLDLRLAHELIGRTRVSRILKAYRDVPAADERAVALVLVKLAQLAADIPEITELDINPLLADRDGVIALDARVAVAPARKLHKGRGHPRFAIFPYPKEWERQIGLGDGTHALVRPVRPEDDALFRAFFARVTDEDLRLRFFQSVKHFSHEFIARLTQLDYARSIALVAIAPKTGDMLGAVRLHADADYERGEYGILIRSDLKGHGIGWQLMRIMIEYARWLGLKQIEARCCAKTAPCWRCARAWASVYARIRRCDPDGGDTPYNGRAAPGLTSCHAAVPHPPSHAGSAGPRPGPLFRLSSRPDWECQCFASSECRYWSPPSAWASPPGGAIPPHWVCGRRCGCAWC